MKKRINKKIAISWCVIILLLAGLPLVVTSAYVQSILILVFYTMGASMAWYIISGMAGQKSLGHASFLAIGAYVTTILLNYYGVSPWLGMLAGAVICGLGAALLFWPFFILKGVYFTICTIAISMTMRNLFLNWNYVGAAGGMRHAYGEDSLLLIRFSAKSSYYWLILIMCVLSCVFVIMLDKTKFGYALKTIRENEDTAMANGINVTRYKVIAIAISAAITSCFGTFYACYYRYIDPDMTKTAFSLELVLPAIVGGLHYVYGPVVGSLILVPIAQICRASLTRISAGFDLAVYSLVLILVIRFQSRGILGWYMESGFRDMLRKRSEKKLESPKPETETESGGST